VTPATLKTMEDVKESFPYPTLLPKQQDNPAYETINATHKKLKLDAAAAIPTTLARRRKPWPSWTRSTSSHL
jgi:hypothetical protein